MPFRPNPLTPFPAREGGKFGGGEVSLRVGPKTPANPKPTRAGKRGVQGAKPPGRGLWGCPPTNSKGGEFPPLSNLPTSGTQSASEPLAHGGGQGGPGGKAPWQGVWGVSPHKTLKGGELSAPALPPRVGPKTLANPKPTGVGKIEGRGGFAPSPGRCPLQNH
jgi:hypothetical protein